MHSAALHRQLATTTTKYVKEKREEKYFTGKFILYLISFFFSFLIPLFQHSHTGCVLIRCFFRILLLRLSALSLPQICTLDYCNVPRRERCSVNIIHSEFIQAKISPKKSSKKKKKRKKKISCIKAEIEKEERRPLWNGARARKGKNIVSYRMFRRHA